MITMHLSRASILEINPRNHHHQHHHNKWAAVTRTVFSQVDVDCTKLQARREGGRLCVSPALSSYLLNPSELKTHAILPFGSSSSSSRHHNTGARCYRKLTVRPGPDQHSHAPRVLLSRAVALQRLHVPICTAVSLLVPD